MLSYKTQRRPTPTLHPSYLRVLTTDLLCMGNLTIAWTVFVYLRGFVYPPGGTSNPWEAATL